MVKIQLPYQVQVQRVGKDAYPKRACEQRVLYHAIDHCKDKDGNRGCEVYRANRQLPAKYPHAKHWRGPVSILPHPFYLYNYARRQVWDPIEK